MTRKDFELIAEVLARFGASRVNGERITDMHNGAVGALLVSEFANALRTTNPRFDSARFVNAATVPFSAETR